MCPIVTSICEEPLRITGCLLVYSRQVEARSVYAITWHVIIPSRGECSSTPVRERRSLNSAELCQNVGAPSEAGNGTAKSPCCRVLSGLPSTVLASDACDCMVLISTCKNRQTGCAFCLFFLCVTVRIRFTPEFERRVQRHTKTNIASTHSPTRCDNRNEHARCFF